MADFTLVYFLKSIYVVVTSRIKCEFAAQLSQGEGQRCRIRKMIRSRIRIRSQSRNLPKSRIRSRIRNKSTTLATGQALSGMQSAEGRVPEWKTADWGKLQGGNAGESARPPLQRPWTSARTRRNPLRQHPPIAAPADRRQNWRHRSGESTSSFSRQHQVSISILFPPLSMWPELQGPSLCSVEWWQRWSLHLRLYEKHGDLHALSGKKLKTSVVQWTLFSISQKWLSQASLLISTCLQNRIKVLNYSVEFSCQHREQHISKRNYEMTVVQEIHISRL